MSRALTKEEREKRFWMYVEKGDGCWVWKGSVRPNKKGIAYGKFAIGKRRLISAHRYSYQIAFGDIPMRLFVCHHCDNTKCVRPDHLFLGTARDNMLDCVLKNRNFKAAGTKNGQAKLNEEAVLEIRNLSLAGYSQSTLSERFGVCQPIISKIVNRKIWRHI